MDEIILGMAMVNYNKLKINNKMKVYTASKFKKTHFQLN